MHIKTLGKKSLQAENFEGRGRVHGESLNLSVYNVFPALLIELRLNNVTKFRGFTLTWKIRISRAKKVQVFSTLRNFFLFLLLNCVMKVHRPRNFSNKNSSK